MIQRKLEGEQPVFDGVTALHREVLFLTVP